MKVRGLGTPIIKLYEIGRYVKEVNVVIYDLMMDILCNKNDEFEGDDDFHCDAEEYIIDINDVINFAPSPIKTVLPI